MNKLLIILIGSIVLTSCQLQKKSIVSKYTGDSRKVMNELIKNNTDFEYFHDKVRMQLKTSSFNQSFTVDLMMKKDSIIWGSASALFGIEVGRFFLTNSELTIIDKMSRKYYTFSSSYLQTLLPFPEINISMLQDLLLRNLILLGKEPYQMNADTSTLHFFTTWNNVRHQFTVLPGIYEITEHQLFNESGKLIGKAQYSGNITGKNFKIPKKIEFWVYLPENNYARISFFEPKFEKKLIFDTNIPDGYFKAN